MTKATDIHLIGTRLYFIPVKTRMPLKFGAETLTSVTCARGQVWVKDRNGHVASGWGETPLSVQWVWPSQLSYEARHQDLMAFCRRVAESWARFSGQGHPIELGHEFLSRELPRVLEEHNNSPRAEMPAMPWLAALICCSVFDIALHDAYGQLLKRPIYELYGTDHINHDLSAFLSPAEGTDVAFHGRYPDTYLDHPRPRLRAWHLVGGLDPIAEADLTGNEPNDGYPVLLTDWIQTDGLKCLKIKLRGTDAKWDYDRLARVGQVAIEYGVEWLTTDFNCTVTDPEYVNAILDRLRDEYPRIYGMILYVEQPFPYDLEANRIDAHSVSARKPLFLDESAHDWSHVRLGRSLGWTGVALKTCKTQTGAILSACWAKAHGMTLMVQDLTNPMLAQIPHLSLAAHVGTIMGVETNSMQFYPEASRPEASIHPGIYQRRNGEVDLRSLHGPGFGYRVSEIPRELPPPVEEFGRFE